MLGTPNSEPEREGLGDRTGRVRRVALSEEMYAAGWVAGQTKPLEEVVALALETDPAN